MNAFAQRAVFELGLYFKDPSILLTNMDAGNREDQSPGPELACSSPSLQGWPRPRGGRGAQCARCDFTHPQPFAITASFSHPLPAAPQPIRISFRKLEHLALGKGQPVLSVALKARTPPEHIRHWAPQALPLGVALLCDATNSWSYNP